MKIEDAAKIQTRRSRRFANNPYKRPRARDRAMQRMLASNTGHQCISAMMVRTEQLQQALSQE